MHFLDQCHFGKCFHKCTVYDQHPDGDRIFPAPPKVFFGPRLVITPSEN